MCSLQSFNTVNSSIQMRLKNARHSGFLTHIACVCEDSCLHAMKMGDMIVYEARYNGNKDFGRFYAVKDYLINVYTTTFLTTRVNEHKMMFLDVYTRFSKILSAWIQHSHQDPHSYDFHNIGQLATTLMMKCINVELHDLWKFPWYTNYFISLCNNSTCRNIYNICLLFVFFSLFLCMEQCVTTLVIARLY
jgi:hypothetical protein